MHDLLIYFLLLIQSILLFYFLYFFFGVVSIIFCRITKDKKRLTRLSKNFWKKLIEI